MQAIYYLQTILYLHAYFYGLSSENPVRLIEAIAYLLAALQINW